MDSILDINDIPKARALGKVLAKVFEYTESLLAPGISLLKLDNLIHNFIVDNNARPACVDYNGYKHATCLSVNDTVVHGVPNNYILKEGDIITLDCAIERGGIFVDKAVTYPVGSIDDESYRLIMSTESALNFAIKKAVVGSTTGDIGSTIYDTISSFGFTPCVDFVGHGIGYKFHTHPAIPNTGLPGTGIKLVNNMCIAIEPIALTGTYPDNKVYTTNDKWTIKTKSNSIRSSHFEDTVIIQNGITEILTRL